MVSTRCSIICDSTRIIRDGMQEYVSIHMYLSVEASYMIVCKQLD